MVKAQWGFTVMAVLSGMILAGCPREPVLQVSATAHHFGVVTDQVSGESTYETEWSFDVTNVGSEGTTLVFTVTSDKPWVQFRQNDGTLSGILSGESEGASDNVTVEVVIDRDFSNLAKELEFASGVVTVEASVGFEDIDITTAPNYFTQSFSGGNDLNGLALTFEPNGGPSFYGQTKSAITDFPTDPTGGLILDFDDLGDPVKAGLFGGQEVRFYGESYDTLYIGSEGWVSFGEEGQAPQTLGDHFSTTQISALPVDATSAGSMVSYLQDDEKLIITYENASSAGKQNSPNDFQIELFFDGTIQLSYVNIDPTLTGVIGLSAGISSDTGTTPEDFLPSDLTDANTGTLKTALIGG